LQKFFCVINMFRKLGKTSVCGFVTFVVWFIHFELSPEMSSKFIQNRTFQFFGNCVRSGLFGFKFSCNLYFTSDKQCNYLKNTKKSQTVITHYAHYCLTCNLCNLLRLLVLVHLHCMELLDVRHRLWTCGAVERSQAARNQLLRRGFYYWILCGTGDYRNVWSCGKWCCVTCAFAICAVSSDCPRPWCWKTSATETIVLWWTMSGVLVLLVPL